MVIDIRYVAFLINVSAVSMVSAMIKQYRHNVVQLFVPSINPIRNCNA